MFGCRRAAYLLFEAAFRNLRPTKPVVKRMMFMSGRGSLIAGLAFALSFSTHAAEVQSVVDWSKFLARHDLVWNAPATNWESGAFIGNGLLGAMIYSSGTNALQWDIGRSDVTDKGDRIAIGRFVLQTGGEITGSSMRLDLWNAEARGELKVGGGAIEWRSFTHANDLVSAIDFSSEYPTNQPSNFKGPKFEFQHLSANPARLEYQNQPVPEDERNPDPIYSETNSMFGSKTHWCLQPLHDGAAYVVAWEYEPLISNNGHSILFFTVDFRPPAKGMTNDSSALINHALAQLQTGLRKNFDDVVATHREWWHAYYPESFLSIPDTRMESFYWIQMYKLASATRADRPAIDLMGPWFRRTPWPHLWWNLNIQLTYWPVYTANRLELGESLTRLIDADRANFINNVPGEWRSDSAGVRLPLISLSSSSPPRYPSVSRLVSALEMGVCMASGASK